MKIICYGHGILAKGDVDVEGGTTLVLYTPDNAVLSMDAGQKACRSSIAPGELVWQNFGEGRRLAAPEPLVGYPMRVTTGRVRDRILAPIDEDWKDPLALGDDPDDGHGRSDRRIFQVRERNGEVTLSAVLAAFAGHEIHWVTCSDRDPSTFALDPGVDMWVMLKGSDHESNRLYFGGRPSSSNTMEVSAFDDLADEELPEEARREIARLQSNANASRSRMSPGPHSPRNEQLANERTTDAFERMAEESERKAREDQRQVRQVQADHYGKAVKEKHSNRVEPYSVLPERRDGCFDYKDCKRRSCAYCKRKYIL